MPLSRTRERLLRRISTRKGREAEAVVLVEGVRALGTALERAQVPPRFAIVEEGRTLPGLEGLVARLEARGVPLERASQEAVRALSATDTPQGILAVFDEPRVAPPGGGGVRERAWLVLDGVQDPGNVGTLVRTAVALGVTRILALDGTADPWSARAVRGSAGLAFALPIHRLPWSEALGWIQEAERSLLVADREGRNVRAFAHDPGAVGRDRWALLLGNEGSGPRAEASAAAAERLAIPLVAGVDSLNVAIAGALLLWALGPGGGAAAPSDPGVPFPSRASSFAPEDP